VEVQALAVRDPQEKWQSVENLIKFEAKEKGGGGDFGYKY